MINYKGFTITPYSEGFKISSGTLNRIASFIVQKGDLLAGFAFAEGFLTKMANPQLKDEDLLREAEEIIKKYIDNNTIKHLEEYTFEYYPSNFISENNPKWWIKTLKKHYS